MDVVFVLYDAMTALDLVGPYQVLASHPELRITLAATERGPRRTDSGMVIHAERALRELDGAELIVVPGTSRPDVPLADAELIGWLRAHGPRARWTTSVCTGALLLGAAGLLRGKRATTHWLAHGALRDFGAEPVRERVVVDGHVITAAGVSAGIDMGLTLLARACGEANARAVQLGIEYDPQPPFDAGAIERADPQLVELSTRMMSAISAAWNPTGNVVA